MHYGHSVVLQVTIASQAFHDTGPSPFDPCLKNVMSCPKDKLPKSAWCLFLDRAPLFTWEIYVTPMIFLCFGNFIHFQKRIHLACVCSGSHNGYLDTSLSVETFRTLIVYKIFKICLKIKHTEEMWKKIDIYFNIKIKNFITTVTILGYRLICT